MRNFIVRDYRISMDQKRFQGCGPIKVVLLSDLHGTWYGQEQKLLVEEIRRQKPDLVVSAGDLVTLGEEPEAALALLRSLAEDFPVYCVNGNHESRIRDTPKERESYRNYRRELKDWGVHYLVNRRKRIRVKGLPMEIAGLEIGQPHYRRVGAVKLTEEEMNGLLEPSSPEVFSLLIAHNPMDFPVYAKWGADLVLSGHLHGGYIRLPILGGVISPQMHLFPKYDRGKFRLGSSQMVVSAGLGDHDIKWRLLNPRELPVIRLE
ncbi:MAG: metallophosphoesterase [Eubacteriales bacterium]|nr:metallophosphoesterase [Eubacteriales bacterium]